MSNEVIQSVIAFGIVGASAAFVGRRLWAQIAAFRTGKDVDAAPCGACGGCEAADSKSGAKPAANTAAPQLVTLSTSPPKRVAPPASAQDRTIRN